MDKKDDCPCPRCGGKRITKRFGEKHWSQCFVCGGTGKKTCVGGGTGKKT